jgi:hypothetical protein
VNLTQYTAFLNAVAATDTYSLYNVDDPTKDGTGGYWLYPTQSDTQPGNTIGSDPNQANYSSSTGSAPYLTEGGAFSNSASHYGTFDDCPCTTRLSGFV